MAAPRKYPVELRARALRLWRSEQPRRPIAQVALGAARTIDLDSRRGTRVADST